MCEISLLRMVVENNSHQLLILKCHGGEPIGPSMSSYEAKEYVLGCNMNAINSQVSKERVIIKFQFPSWLYMLQEVQTS